MIKRNLPFLLLLCSLTTIPSLAQRTPCTTNPIYRQFDFWIGNWEAFGKGEKKAGDSKISLILDSCVILEEWTSTTPIGPGGIPYTGKSFNTYNANTQQWQQTWVDNVGGSTAYLEGRFENNKIIFKTAPFKITKDTIATRKLSFFKLSDTKVRQLGEITKDNGLSWKLEFDLEYRKKNSK